jgi:hypothetical protein
MLFVLSLAAGPVLAQTATPPKEPGQVRLGPVYFSPYAGLTNVGFDSNFENSAADRQWAFTFSAQVGERIQIAGRKFRLDAAVGAVYVYYSVRRPGQSGINPGLQRFNVEYAFSPRLTFYSREGRFSYATTRPNFEIDTPVRRKEAEVGLGFRYTFTRRAAADVEIRWYRVAYDSGATYQGVNLGTALNGSRNDQRLSFRYQLTPWTEIYLPIWWQQQRFDVDDSRRGNSRTVGGGIRFNKRALVSGSLELGHLSFAPSATTVPGHTGLYTTGVLTFNVNDSTTVQLSAQNNTSYSYDVARAYYPYQWYQVTLRQRLGQHFDIGPYFNYFGSRYAAGTMPSDFARIWGGSVAYRRNQSRYEVFASHGDRTSAIATFQQYSGWRFGFRIETPRFRIDDRGMFLNGPMGLGWIQQ